MNLSTHIGEGPCFPVLILRPTRPTVFRIRAAHIAITPRPCMDPHNPLLLTKPLRGSADTRSSSIPLCPAHCRVLWPLQLGQPLPPVQLQRYRVLAGCSEPRCVSYEEPEQLRWLQLPAATTAVVVPASDVPVDPAEWLRKRPHRRVPCTDYSSATAATVPDAGAAAEHAKWTDVPRISELPANAGPELVSTVQSTLLGSQCEPRPILHVDLHTVTTVYDYSLLLLAVPTAVSLLVPDRLRSPVPVTTWLPPELSATFTAAIGNRRERIGTVDPVAAQLTTATAAAEAGFVCVTGIRVAVASAVCADVAGSVLWSPQPRASNRSVFRRSATVPAPRR